MTRKLIAVNKDTHETLVKILPRFASSGVTTIGGLVAALVKAEYDRRTE